MTELEKIIRDKEQNLIKEKENILKLRERYLDDKEELLNLKEQLIMESRQSDKPADSGLSLDLAKETIENMRKDMLSDIKNKSNMYKKQLEDKYQQKLEQAESEIRNREKSKYEMALSKMREENNKLVKQLYSNKIGA